MRYLILYIAFILTFGALASSCTKQRDLYVTAKPMFIIKNDWRSVARLSPGGATAMLYARADPCERMTNNASKHKLYLESNTYDILVFNEVMFSPAESNLDGIYYRGTDLFTTFGAYSKPTNVNSVFRSSSEEVMVGYGYPVPLATLSTRNKEVLSEKEYVMKYQDGKNGFPAYSDFDADSVEFTPVRVTRDVKVVAHVRNLKTGFRISGTLHGMAEGVLLADRQPGGANAIYTFDMNSPIIDPEVEGGNIITSVPFATFGPWWNQYPSERTYNLEIVARWNGDIYRYNFDVTENNSTTVTCSMGEAMVTIMSEEALFVADGTPPPMNVIVIEVWFELPVVVGDNLDVGVEDWGQDIIIPIPIGF